MPSEPVFRPPRARRGRALAAALLALAGLGALGASHPPTRPGGPGPAPGLAPGPAPGPAQEAAGDAVTGRFGVWETTLEDLDAPGGLLVDPSGRLWVAPGRAAELRVFGALAAGEDGASPAPEARWPLPPDDDELPPRAGGLARDADGRLYVSDTRGHRVLRLDEQGRVLRDWGGHGAVKGRFVRPRGLAVAGDVLLVADEGNHRIQRLALGDGDPLEPWTGAAAEDDAAGADGDGAPDGLRRPHGLALDEAGRLFVADTGNHRVVVLGPDGERLATLGRRGPFAGLFAEPQDVACAGGRLYVADTQNHRVQVFDIDAVLAGEARPLYEWGKHALRPGEGAGHLHYPDSIRVDTGGERVFVGESSVDRVQVFGPARGPVALYAADPSLRPGFAPHDGPPVAARDPLLLLTEPESQTVQVFDRRGRRPVLVHRLGGWGRELGRHERVEGVAFGPHDLVFVTDADGARVTSWRLDRDPEADPGFDFTMGHLVQSLDLEAHLAAAPAPGGPWPRVEPVAVAAGPDGVVHVADAAGGRVLSFRWPDGEVTSRRGPLRRPVDLARDAGGRILVADAGRGRLVVLPPLGDTVELWGRDVLEEPGGVAVAPDGRVYVTDTGRHRVEVFESTGRHVAGWGAPGLGAGEFHRPRGVAWSEGQVVVVDHGNHRAQVFTPEGEFVSAFGSRLYVDATREREEVLR